MRATGEHPALLAGVVRVEYADETWSGTAVGGADVELDLGHASADDVADGPHLHDVADRLLQARAVLVVGRDVRAVRVVERRLAWAWALEDEFAARARRPRGPMRGGA